MAEGVSGNLFFTAAVAVLIGVLALRRHLPPSVLLAVMLVKVTIALLYFSAYANGTWNILDDRAYYYAASRILNQGGNPLMILNNNGFTSLIFLAGGRHMLYFWWNVLTIWTLGDHYYVPVFINIGLTAVTGLYMTLLLEKCGFSVRYRQAFLLFFLLHWDTIAWSSFLDVKDPLTMTLTSASLYYMALLTARPRFREVAKLGFALFLLFWVRFYAIPLLLGALGGWYFLQIRDYRRYFIIAPVLVLLVRFRSLASASLSGISLKAMPFGLIRYPLTPQPWSLNKVYGFLYYPSLLNWLTLLPSLYIVPRLWRHSLLTRLPLLYMAGVYLLGAASAELQGPRGRAQIVFLLAWLQFHVLVTFYRTFTQPEWRRWRLRLPLLRKEAA